MADNTTIVSPIVSGDTAWMLTSTALVLFMTIPGLALYYSGMVREKNVIATVMQSFAITCLITFLWLLCGYSFAFAPATAGVTSSPLFGDASQIWLRSMTISSTHQSAGTIPESVYCAYQATFAIITAALICGSFADRMRFGPMLIFMALWHIVVYCPIAHAIWHPEGFLFKAGSLDYAGGNVVHISSGVSGLVAAIILGHRKGYGSEVFEPHNVLLTAVGASMLWVGWFGFNAGSAVSAGTSAGYAMLATHIAASLGALSWMATEWIMRGKPGLTGMVSGAVAGLVCITPASGFVNPTGAFVIGLLSGPVCYFGAQLKHKLGYDDALDAFGVHAIGGILGGLLTGFFASGDVSPGHNGVFYATGFAGAWQLLYQIYAILFSIGWSAVVSFILLKGIDLLIGLRVSESEEEIGLDHSQHGESLGKVLHYELDTQKQLIALKAEGILREVDSITAAV